MTHGVGDLPAHAETQSAVPAEVSEMNSAAGMAPCKPDTVNYFLKLVMQGMQAGNGLGAQHF